MAAARSVTPHGLATVAMLKVNFDAGRDHIGMFEPFVLDVIADLGRDMDADEVCYALGEKHDLSLPQHTMQTLLGRIAKRRQLKRLGGRYFRTDIPMEVPDLARERSEVENRQTKLAEHLRARAEEAGSPIESDDAALELILAFLQEHHVGLAIDETPDVPEPRGDESGIGAVATKITARFLLDTMEAGGEDAEILQEMLEGFVLKGALFLADISAAERRFDDLQVFVDSQMLFAAFGMHGSSARTATLELLELLKKTGAFLNVFDATVEEMRRVLAVHESRIGTSEGRASLRQTPLTRHLLTQRATPSDVRVEASLLESRLRKLGFTPRTFPTHRPKWTLDEGALGKRLAGEKGENEPRVVHDVGCVAGVLTYRRGQFSDSLDRAIAVFVTTSGLTVKTVREWYRDEGGKGFPPIVHQMALSNYVWLKDPASATTMKEHELTALCGAALKPSQETWERFLRHLRALREKGELTTDEITAIVANELTDNVLAETEFHDDVDADSLTEVVERVKASYKEDADQAIASAEERATRSEESAAQLRRSVQEGAALAASVVSWIAFAVLGVAAVAGTIVTLSAALSGEEISEGPAIVTVVTLAILGLLGGLNGFNLLAARRTAEDWLREPLVRWLTGRQHGQDERAD